MFHIWSLGSASSVPVLGGVLLFIFIIAHIISFNPCHKLEEVGVFSPMFKMKKQGFQALTSTAFPFYCSPRDLLWLKSLFLMAGDSQSSREPSMSQDTVVTASPLSPARSQLLLQGCLLPEVGEPESEECEIRKHQIRLAGLLSRLCLPQALPLRHLLPTEP